MPTGAVDDEPSAFPDVDVAECEAEQLAATQPGQQYRVNHRLSRQDRSAPINATTATGDRILRNVRGTCSNGTLRGLA